MPRPSALAEPAPDARGLARLGLTRRAAALLLGMSAALLASELAETVVATTLPSIAADLDDVGLIALVTTAFLLTATLVLPAYGWLADRFGRRRVFTGAVAVFVAGSVLGALAPTPAALVAARLVQGLGAGGLLVLVQAEVAALVPLRQRAAVMSGIGAAFALAVVVGPPLGGWLASGPGWRWAFWVVVPLAVAALVVSLVLMPADRPGPGRRPPRAPWRLLARHQVSRATVGAFVVGACAFGAVAYLPTYLQLALALPPARAGLLMLALFGGLGGATVAAGQVVRRAGRVRALLVAGAAAVTAGLVVLAAGRGTLVAVVPALVLVGVGIGSVWEVVVVVVQATAAQAEAGTATGTVNLVRELGVLVGTAAVGGWVTHRLAAGPDVAGARLASWSPERLAAAEPAVRAGVGAAYGAAFGPVLWTLAAVSVLAVVAFARLRPWSAP